MTAQWLENATVYGAPWEEVNRESIPDEVLERVSSVTVKMSEGRHDDEYDFDGRLELVVTLDNGGQVYWPLSNRSELLEGDSVDPETIEMITLAREGDDDTYRYDGEKLAKPAKKR